MEELYKPTVIRGLLERHGFSFSKGLGQNFLINPSVCPRMAELGGAAPGVGVLEIGPGFGVLTRELALRAERVVAVELDTRLQPVLAETLADCTNVKVIWEDAMSTDLAALIAREFGNMPVVVCANLPYYITSPLIMRLLESRLPINSVTVMVQKEAARRLVAEPGTREVGAVSIAVRYFSEPQLLFAVSRGSFMPAPAVDSAVIKLTLRGGPEADVRDEALFFKVVRGAFEQRRKTLPNSLSAALALPKSELLQLLEACSISHNARAEQLSMAQFAAIANGLAARA